MQHSLNLLAIADHASSLEQVLNDLREVGFEPNWQHIHDDQAFLQYLKSRVELIVAFHGTTGFNAFNALQILQEQRLSIPLIVVGGPNNAEQAVLAMKRGAADYLPRQRMGSLGIAAANAIVNSAPHTRSDTLAQALANSQYRKKAILKAAPDAILTFDGDGRIVEANPAADVLFANGKLVGKRLSDVIMASSLLSDTSEWITWLAADENPLLGRYVEINAIRNDGRTFPAEVSMVRIPASTPALSTCFIRDISARKQLEAEALGRQTTTLEAVINSMADGVVLADNQGRIILMNPAGEAMVGIGATDAPSESWPGHFGLFRPDGKSPLPVNEVPLWRALLGEPQDEVEVFVRNARLPEGTLLSVNARPIVYGAGPVLGAVAVFRDITHRRRAEELLRRSEEQFRKLFEEDLTGNFIATADGKITAFNPAFVRMFGNHASQGHLELKVAALLRNPESWQELLDKLHKEHRIEGLEVECQRADGKLLYTIQNVVGGFDEQGNLTEIKGYIFDNSERRQLEDQFRQAQKMEAVGKLAGGVAHDFNNLLTVINGYSQLILGNLNSSDPLRESVEQIKQAGDRAARLTSQLLAFSRKQVLIPVSLDLNALLSEMEKMVGRLIGEDMELTVIKDPDLWRIKADAGQVEQVILNLVVNARDAMPQGGKLTVETRNVVQNHLYGKEGGAAHSGEYVMLAISDTGCGMDKATLARIFEPFFTTKPPDKGTGLGLATVYGIIKQSGGQIDVKSDVGKGTTFNFLLPRAQQSLSDNSTKLSTKAAARGTETVLLAEDEDGVRTLARLILQSKGYKVLDTRNGGEALLVCEQHKEQIDILVTDVIMPNMSGKELSERLSLIRPKMKVLYLSGYTDDTIGRHGVLDAKVPFLHKPFTPDGLAHMVRNVLDKP